MVLVSILIEFNGRLKQFIGLNLLRSRVITTHVSGLLEDVLMIFSLSLPVEQLCTSGVHTWEAI